MVMPSSPNEISMEHLLQELNLVATGSKVSLGDSACRTMANKPSGAISLFDLYGKTGPSIQYLEQIVFTSVSHTTNSISIAWNAVQDANRYRLAFAPMSPTFPSNIEYQTGLTKTWSGLDSGRKYQFWVFAENTSTGKTSAEWRGKSYYTYYTAITGLSLQMTSNLGFNGGASFELSWTKPPSPADTPSQFVVQIVDLGLNGVKHDHLQVVYDSETAGVITWKVYRYDSTYNFSNPTRGAYLGSFTSSGSTITMPQMGYTFAPLTDYTWRVAAVPGYFSNWQNFPQIPF